MLKNQRFGKLFRKYGECHVPGGVVYLKALSKLAAQERQRLAIEAAADTRRELRDKTSELFERHIKPIEEAKGSDKQRLVDTIVNLSRDVFADESRQEVVRMDYPEPPDNPDVNDMIDTAEADEKVESELVEARVNWVDQQLNTLREELDGLPLKDLRERCSRSVTNNLVGLAWTDMLYHATVCFVSFKDPECKQPLLGIYTTTEEIESAISELPDSVYGAIVSDYGQLDSWSGEELKN